MSGFIFRGECIHDVLDFLAVVAERARIANCSISHDPQFPDCEVELDVFCSLSDLQLIAEGMTDLHTISESMEGKR